LEKWGSGKLYSTEFFSEIHSRNIECNPCVTSAEFEKLDSIKVDVYGLLGGIAAASNEEFGMAYAVTPSLKCARTTPGETLTLAIF
jgi:hypothetical protein